MAESAKDAARKGFENQLRQARLRESRQKKAYDETVATIAFLEEQLRKL